jgi:hypothetical protein
VRAAFAAVVLGALAALAAPGRADDEPGELEALRIATVFGAALATPEAPPDHYAEQWDGRAFWLPGVVEPTPLVRKVIREARAKAASGESVRLRVHAVEGARVWTSPSPPFAGVFSLGAGERRAWIAGVGAPDAAQLRALESVLVAETGELPARPAPPTPPADAPFGTGVLREKSAAAAAERAPDPAPATAAPE